jgi:WD40 repeat protein
MDMTVANDGTLVSCSKDSIFAFFLFLFLYLFIFLETVKFWDPETHLCKSTTVIHDKNLNAICTMPDGSIAIAKDNVIKFYNYEKDEFEKALTGHTKTIFAL